MGFFDAADRNEFRNFVGDFLTNTVRLYSYAEPAFNEATGNDEPPAHVLVWEGQGLVKTSSGGRPISLGQEIVVYQSTQLLLPWDSYVPKIDDLVEVTQADDPSVVNRIFRITEVATHYELIIRRCSLEVLEPSRNFSP